ncbi:MAG: Histidine kinase [Lachnoclostridium sp.]|jgi:predicted transcriptional regulator
MTIQEIQKTLDEQTKLLDSAAQQLVNAPEDVKERQEKIFQIVKEQLTSVANEIAKYADKF